MLMLTSIWYVGLLFGGQGTVYALLMAVLYFTYNISTFIIANKRLVKPERLVIATAILDPLMLSAWLVFTEEAAPLFTCFYMFTTLGYGFRIGPRAMWINQIASLAGFLCAMAFSPFWQSNLLASASVFILLVAVPMYATILIQKLLDARAWAEFQSHAKSQLLANVSHELRTPLNGIVATAQIMKNESSSRAVKEQSDTILELSRDLLLEINELLDSAKYHSQSINLEKQPFDINSIAERLRRTLSQNAAAKGIALAVTVDAEIEDDICSDEHHLLRVLMNIASNAVKFTDHGNVSINFALLNKTPEQYKIRFSVEDTGIGIPANEQKKIFEPFYQVSCGASKKQAGTGLGMSIAYDIVKMLGGQIELESKVGKGSTFYFDLPMERISRKTRHQDTDGGQPVITGKRILVVEDHPLNLMLAKKMLEIDQHQVTAVTSGGEAIQSFNASEFDLILLDYNLEDMSGIDIMEAYLGMHSKPAPIYFLTADATDVTRHALLEKGAAGVLHKPLILDGLRQAIASHFPPDAGCHVRKIPDLLKIEPHLL
jgi:two-component system sensor histidine kinase RpfC